jgi:hypothetical protein
MRINMYYDSGHVVVFQVNIHLKAQIISALVHDTKENQYEI